MAAVRCCARRTAASATAQNPADTRYGTTSPVAAATAPPAAGPDQRSERPGGVHQAEGHALGQPAPLGAFGDQREGGSEERAVRAAGEDDERHVGERARADREADGDGDGDGQRNRDREQDAAAVEQPARDRRDHGLDAALTSQTSADRGCSPAGGGQVERRKRREDAEQEGRQRHQDEPADEEVVAQRPSHRGEGRHVGRDRLDAQRPERQARPRAPRAR